MKQRKKKKMSKKAKIILVVILLLIIGVLGCFLLTNDKEIEKKIPKKKKITKEEEQIKVVDLSSTERPIAVMINNNKAVWGYQAGIQDAYITYEMIVEGGITRMMAVFKDKNTERIASVRSSRHYYLDYALENDAIYVHYGWSPKAENDISKLKVNNINGITELSGKDGFWRVKDKARPHNAVTSTKNILNMATKKGYKTTSEEKSVLNYVEDEVELESDITANTVKIPYSTLHSVEYKYNKEKKVYERYARGERQKDWDSKDGIDTKNIIVTFAKNTELKDGENKDRQDLEDVGVLNGYYITNGKAIKIKCEKLSRTAKTVYKDLAGEVIDVNDGNTFVQICPIDSKVTFEE